MFYEMFTAGKVCIPIFGEDPVLKMPTAIYLRDHASSFTYIYIIQYTPLYRDTSPSTQVHLKGQYRVIRNVSCQNISLRF